MKSQSTIKASQRLKPQDLVDLQIPQDVRISPSGRHVLYSLSPSAKAEEHPVSSLWIADVEEAYSARPLTSGSSCDKHPQWSPDGQAIAFISDRAERGNSSVLYLLPTGIGEAYSITGVQNKAAISSFKWSPDGKFIAFLSADEKTAEQKQNEKDKKDVHVYGQDWDFQRLRLLDVATKKISTLVSQNAHVNGFAWGDGGDEIIYVLQETPDLNSPYYHGVRIERVSVVDHKSAYITSFPGPIMDLIWSKTDLLFISGFTPDSECTSLIVYRLSVDEGRVSKYAYGKEDCAVELRWTGRTIAVHVQAGLHDQIHLLKGSIIYDRLQEITTWDLLSAGQEDTLVLGRSTISSPVEIYSIKGGHTYQLSRHGASVAKVAVGTTHPIYCTTEDGTVLDGLFLTPSKTVGDHPWPTVVVPHGGPYYRVTEAFDLPHLQWAPWLLSLGYAVLSPNYRGGSSHGEQFASAARGAMGTTDYSDVVTMLKYCISQKWIDEGRVMIGGWSQGGFLSYLAVTRKGFQFRGAICGAGVSDWDALCITSDKKFFEAELRGGAPWDPYARPLSQSSALRNMKDVNTPILILHGEEDKRVPLPQALGFHRGCLHFNIPCKLVTYPREPHMIAERNHRIDMLQQIEEFCKSCI